MRANISNELINSINERIYLDLEIHVLTNKMNKSDNENFKQYVDKIIIDLIKDRKVINDNLNANGIKIHEVKEIDEMFVKYSYSQKIMGGFKEGTIRYWKDTLKLELKKRLSKYFR